MFNKLLSAVNNGGPVDILTIIDSSPENRKYIGHMMIIHPHGVVEGEAADFPAQRILDKVRTSSWSKPVTFSIVDRQGGTYRIFWDRVITKSRAVVFGGGHISQPLVQILALLDFKVTVVDDRLEFANTTRFPAAEKVICQGFNRAFDQLAIDEETAVIIVTRGHRYDLECLRATLNSRARYLGMIGSKRRIREIINLLQEEGAPESLLRRVRAPIGLDIGAQTPAEIAVSIAAEAVMAFRGGSGFPISGFGR